MAVQFVIREWSARLGRELIAEQVVIVRAAGGQLINLVGHYDTAEFRRLFWDEEG